MGRFASISRLLSAAAVLGPINSAHLRTFWSISYARKELDTSITEMKSALTLLSLVAVCGIEGSKVVRPAGLEPATFGSGGQRSIQLSYGREGNHHTSFEPQVRSCRWVVGRENR